MAHRILITDDNSDYRKSVIELLQLFSGSYRTRR